MYQQQYQHAGQQGGQQYYLVRGPNGEKYYVTGNQLQHLQQNLQVQNTTLQVRRKSSTRTASNENVHQGVRRKSSTRGASNENVHQGPREVSQSVKHLAPIVNQNQRRSISEERQSQDIRALSTNVTPGEHRSRRDKSPGSKKKSSRRSTTSSQHERGEHKSHPTDQQRPLIGFEGLLLTSQRQPTTEQKHHVSGEAPVIGWDVGESSAPKTNEHPRLETNKTDSTKGRTENIKSDTAVHTSSLATSLKITINDENISEAKSSTAQIEPSQSDNNQQEIKPEQVEISSKIEGDLQINKYHQPGDIDNRHLENIIITEPKESQENLKSLNKGPSNISKGPGYINKGPASLNKGSIDSAKGPSEITNGPADLNKGPGNLSKGPCDLNQGPINLWVGPSKLAKGRSALCCGPSISVRGPSLSKGSCNATIGPTLSKGPAILNKGSLKQTVEAL